MPLRWVIRKDPPDVFGAVARGHRARWYIDEHAVWMLTRFADEPGERVASRLTNRLQARPTRGKIVSPATPGPVDPGVRAKGLTA
jgi:hypothetical protein